MYRLGVRMDVTNSSNVIQRSGEAWLSTHRIAGDEAPYGLQLSPPIILDQTAPAVPYRYIVAQHNDTGEVKLLHCGITPSHSSLTGYSAAYVTFASFPVDQLVTAMTDASTTMELASGTGFRDGDVAYIDDEQLLITAGQGTTTKTVTRAHNGTTAAAHAVSAVVRGTVDDEQLRYVHVWDEGNTLATNTRMSVISQRQVPN